MKTLTLKLALFVACLTAAGALQVRKCPTGEPTPLDVKINGCKQMPCAFKKGSTAVIEATGSADHDVEEIQLAAVIDFNGIPLMVPLDESDGCKLLVNASCPVPKNTVVTLRSTFDVIDVLPEKEYVLTVTVSDQEDDVVSCFEGNVVLTK